MELTKEQQIHLLRDFTQRAFVSQGMVADIALHRDNLENPHAHILLTTRKLTSEGFGPKHRDWNARAELLKWREQWGERRQRTPPARRPRNPDRPPNPQSARHRPRSPAVKSACQPSASDNPISPAVWPTELQSNGRSPPRMAGESSKIRIGPSEPSATPERPSQSTTSRNSFTAVQMEPNSSRPHT